MSYSLRSDSDDGQGRVRAATYPRRPSRRPFDHQPLTNRREKGVLRDLPGCCNTSPAHGDLNKRNPVVLSNAGSRTFLQKKKWRGDGEGGVWAMTTRIISPTPTSYESGSGTSRSDAAWRGLRQRRHKAWEDAGSPTRQQRLFSAVFGLVVFLASVQIISLITHPPRESQYSKSGLSVNGNAHGDSAGEEVNEVGSIARRRTPGGGRGAFLRAASDDNRWVATTPLRGGVGREFNGVEQHQGLSLSSPRAFEMVAADMGNLKDSVEKLDLGFRKIMAQQAKDLAALMTQLGLESGENTIPPRKTEPNTADGASKQALGRPGRGWDRENSSPPFAARNKPEKASSDALSKKGAITGSQDSGLVGGGGGGEMIEENTEESAVQVSREGGEGAGVKEGGGGVGTIWNAYSRGKWINGQWIPKVLLDDTKPDLSRLPENQRRVLLLSERRSGGQAIGGILDTDSRVFYIADPCRMGGGPEALDSSACSLAVTRLIACQPTIKDIRNLYSFSHIVERSRPLSELEKFRWHVGGTPEENDELVRTSLVQKCRESEVVVIKETRLTEVPPNLSAVALGIDFLHVVRDPRAAVHGLAVLWEGSKSKYDHAMAEDCTDLATRLCSLTEKKLADLSSLGKARFRVLKYEMALEAPFAMMKSVYSWLKLGDFPPEVREAVTSMSTWSTDHSSQKPSPMEDARNTMARFEWATRWTVEMSNIRRKQIQHVCQPLLFTLNYEKPKRSPKSQRKQRQHQRTSREDFFPDEDPIDPTVANTSVGTESPAKGVVVDFEDND